MSGHLPPRSSTLALPFTLVWVLAAACGDGGTAPPNPAAAMTLVSGDAQEDTIGGTLGAPLVVRVTDEAGAGVPGVPVQFLVSAGFATLSPATVETDAEGKAEAEVTLGSVAGDFEILARPAEGPHLEGAPVSFTGAVRAGAPADLVAVRGEEQRFFVEAELPEPLSVEVRDRGANLLRAASVPVEWRVLEGSGVVEPAAPVTDGTGRASATWTLGPEPMEQRVEARAADVPPVVFRAHAVEAGPIAYVTGSFQGIDPSWIEVSRPDGGDRVALPVGPARRFGGVGWAPDGTRLVVNQVGTLPFGLYVYRLDGSPPVTVLETSDPAAQPFDPTWSPDGEWIAFARGGDIYAIRPDGSGLRAVIQSASVERDPAWHPEGSEISFVRDLESGGRGIFASTLDGSEVRTLVADSGRFSFAPAWSPDGKLAYTRVESAGVFNILILDPQAGSTEPLALGTPLAWSPDGTRLLAQDETASGTRLFIVDAATGVRTPIETEENARGGDWRR